MVTKTTRNVQLGRSSGVFRSNDYASSASTIMLLLYIVGDQNDGMQMFKNDMRN